MFFYVKVFFFIQFFFVSLICYGLFSKEEYTVIYCHDGDTCRVKDQNNVLLKIRLIGIDAPEIGNGKNNKVQPYATKSKKFINNLIQNKKVRLKIYSKDIYGRELSEIFLGNENINLKMIEKGFAEVYQGTTNKLVYKKLYEEKQQLAKSRRVGIWSLKDYESPKEFRNREK
jgi:endonuclease YncB( thermonuclease family)